MCVDMFNLYSYSFDQDLDTPWALGNGGRSNHDGSEHIHSPGRHCDTPEGTFGYRESAALVILAAATVAEAKAHPMLPLLHGLLCHVWDAALTSWQKKHTSPSAPAPVRREFGSKTAPSHLEGQAQQSEADQHEQMGRGGRMKGAEFSLGQQQAGAHWLEMEVLLEGQQGECDRQKTVTGRQERQHQSPVRQQPGLGEEQVSSQQHKQGLQALDSPASAQHVGRLHAWSKPSAGGTAREEEAHALHCKLLLCVVVLQALPCVAWLKQPMHMRQLAAWQDAVSCAVLATHASILALLVGLSVPKLALLVYAYLHL